MNLKILLIIPIGWKLQQEYGQSTELVYAIEESVQTSISLQITQKKNGVWLCVLWSIQASKNGLFNLAFIIVNDDKLKIKLKEAHSTYFYIEEESTNTDANGNTTTSISTRDFLLFKKECNLSEVVLDVRSSRILDLSFILQMFL